VVAVTTATERLPPGRHGLSRDQVASSQRARMLRAMAEAVSENGFASTPVAEVLRRARVSRETFYENFANREDCFLAAYEASVALVMAAIEDAARTAAGGAANETLGRVIERYLATLAQEPAAARTFMVEVYGAGEAALARRNEVQTRFVDQVAALLGAETAAQRFACEMVVAAVIGLVTQWICAGRADELTDLHQPLMENVESMLSLYGLPART